LVEVIAAWREAIRLRPGYSLARVNLGSALCSDGKHDEGTVEYRTAIRLQPDYADAHYILGVCLSTRDKLEEAIAEYRTAIRLKPDLAVAHNQLAWALALLPVESRRPTKWNRRSFGHFHTDRVNPRSDRLHDLGEATPHGVAQRHRTTDLLRSAGLPNSRPRIHRIPPVAPALRSGTKIPTAGPKTGPKKQNREPFWCLGRDCWYVHHGSRTVRLAPDKFDPYERKGGANTTGAVVDSGVLNPEPSKRKKGGRIYPKLRVRDRIDAIISRSRRAPPGGGGTGPGRPRTA
jgi:Tetratricopeptide repeat